MGFLQSDEAVTLSNRLRTLLDQEDSNAISLDLHAAETLSEFLQGKTTTGGTGEIVGILKMMKETAEESQGEAGKEEAKAAKAYEALSNSLSDLIKTAGVAIEKKTELAGTTAVKVV